MKPDIIFNLPRGGILNIEQYLVSPSGLFRFVLQADGNAVIYMYKNKSDENGSSDRFIYAHLEPNITNTKDSSMYLQLGTDCNLVIYSKKSKAYPLTTNTAVKKEHINERECYLSMQDDGNLVLYYHDNKNESKNISLHSHNFTFFDQLYFDTPIVPSESDNPHILPDPGQSYTLVLENK